MSFIFLNRNKKVCLEENEGEAEVELVGEFKGGKDPQWKNNDTTVPIPVEPKGIDMNTGEVKRMPGRS